MLGSPWIAWLGVLGALAHGAAAALVVLLEIEWARSGWILTAFWPRKATGGVASVEPV